MTQALKDVQNESLQQAAQHLRSGGLVAFPTETVYGLGADASNPESVRLVYKVKGRPSTDPLIVHVVGFSEAAALVDKQKTNAWQLEALRVLSEQFWPGPLTLILPANLSLIANDVTAGTGWVGLRSPAHPVAQKFLQFAQVPVAAPSANLFGHVSPTTAAHVQSDFPDVDSLWIIDGGRCGFGIESSVVRINADQTVDMFRRGGVGPAEIVTCLVNAGLAKVDNKFLNVIEKFVSQHDGAAQSSPGQLLVHYAPRLKTQLISIQENQHSTDFREMSLDELRRTVVLDFAGRLANLKASVGHYRDLSPAGDLRGAVYSLFDSLRWAESVVESDGLLWIFDPLLVEHKSDELFLALQDRIFRAASGRTASVSIKQDSGRACVLIRSR